jgi:hypothetical protein
MVCTATDQCRNAGTCDPGTGACVGSPKPDGAACNDANACTVGDACRDGTCVGGAPFLCVAPNDCRQAGTCNPATGSCVSPPKADGVACDDGNACTRGDACRAGMCAAGEPITCVATGACREAGTCDPTTGSCREVPTADGTGCDDGDRCTQRDVCVSGACEGRDPVVCVASDQCHDAGRCDPGSGVCSNPPARDGTACDDGDACTRIDTCTAGQCRGTDPLVCTAVAPCRDAGRCDPRTGQCLGAALADGVACDDGDVCSVADACVTGACRGEPAPDQDGDGLCDWIDVCPEIADPDQLDIDGAACRCTAPAPGDCLMGGGSKRTDCFVEYRGTGPAIRRGGRVKPVLQCSDGDPGCDVDGVRNGTCTFGIAMCFGNADPRLERCSPEHVIAAEVLYPSATRSAADAGNAARLEEAFATLGLEVRRRGRIVAGQVTPVGANRCSAPVALELPAPSDGDGATRRRFLVRAETVNGRRDTDRFDLVCR